MECESVVGKRVLRARSETEIQRESEEISRMCTMFWEFHRHIAGNDCEDGVVVVGTVCAKENGRKGNGRKESGRKEDGRKNAERIREIGCGKIPVQGPK